MGRARRLLQRGEAAVPPLLRRLHLAQLLARVQDGGLGALPGAARDGATLRAVARALQRDIQRRARLARVRW